MRSGVPRGVGRAFAVLISARCAGLDLAPGQFTAERWRSLLPARLRSPAYDAYQCLRDFEFGTGFEPVPPSATSSVGDMMTCRFSSYADSWRAARWRSRI